MPIDAATQQALDAVNARVSALEARPAAWLTVSQFRDRASEQGNDQVDALERLAAAARKVRGQQRVRIDLEGLRWQTSRPITLDGPPVLMRDGEITALPSAEWEGGSTDSTGTPCAKGVIRLASDSHDIRDVNLNCGGVACGFEDAPVAARNGNHSRGNSISGCRVMDFERYGYRYASEDGGGMRLHGSTGRKFRNALATMGRDADLNTGYPLILDAGDGEFSNNVFWGGERQIMQFRKGTITLIDCHPWQPPSYYTRQISGPAGVPVVMEHQVRSLDEVTFDPAQVAVSRDEVWRIVFTPVVNIDPATPATVVYRRDPVNVELRGFGSTGRAIYCDGGTVRIHGHTPDWDVSPYLIGGAQLPNGRVPAVYELVAAFRGQLFDLSQLRAIRHGAVDARCIAYPNINKPGALPGNATAEMAAF